MLRAGAEIMRKEAPVQKSISVGFPAPSLENQQLVTSAPAWTNRFKVKIYIDELEVGDLWGVLIRLPLYLVDVIKEEWFWWTKLYKFEISSPIDFEKDRAKVLAESRRRAKKHGVTFQPESKERR